MELETRYKDFVLTRSKEIPELQISLVELVHMPTGATVIHLASDDDENLFCLSFRTWPTTSNGVAHVLEHTVLCGSKKFPVRDPFFAMSRRSLNTFMNALTGADFTCYPASSQVPKDFYNLLEVYLDAVFKPILNKKSFLQEGHRLEFLDPDDSRSPLCIKGIVFNEMKGSLANPNTRLGEALMEGLFPNLTYGVNSGGDPKVIPHLTYEELKEFHQKFYHPSRCLFFFYGNLPLEQHLAFIEERVLKGTEKHSPLPPLPPQSRFQQKVYRTLSYPIAENEDLQDKTFIGMGWLTCPILEQQEILALNIIDLVLMGTDASPLKMALLKSGLCKQAESSLEGEFSEVPYVLVCRGCPDDAGGALETIIRDTLTKIVSEGLPSHLVEGAIHQLELSRYEITGNSAPYGLALFFRSALLLQHGGKPEDGLMIHSLFKQIRERVKDPEYLPRLIQHYLLDNTHFVAVTMHPDKELAAKEAAEEQDNLQLIRASLSDHTVDLLINQAKELLVYQEEEKEQDIEILPKVTLSDVPKHGKGFALHRGKTEKWTCFHHPCFTNEILYADLAFDLPHVPEEDLSFLRLFSLILPQIGCGGRNYKDHLDYILEHTGGIGTSLDLSLQVEDPSVMKPMFIIRGKALHRKVDKLFPLFRDLLTSADFTDMNRLKELLMQHFHGVKNSIQNQSLRYAVNLAASALSVPSKIINSWYGLDYYWCLKKIVETFEQNPFPFVEKMQSLQELCLGVRGGDLILSCDEAILEKLKGEQFFGLNEVPAKPYTPWKGDYPLIPVSSQGRLTSAPVAFTAMILPSISYLHPDAASLSLASEIMENNILHKRIREQGGAYGAGAVHALLSGQFYFYSFRDPNLSTTLEAFSEAVEDLAGGKVEKSDLEEAKLGLIQDLDSPCAPGSRAMTAYGRWRSHLTPERRQTFREQMLAANLKEVKKAVSKHLLPLMKKGVIVSFAGKELFEKENALLQKHALPLFPIDE